MARAVLCSLGAESKMRSNFTPANPKALDRGGAIKMFAVSASPSGQVMLLICVAVFALMGDDRGGRRLQLFAASKEHDADRGGQRGDRRAPRNWPMATRWRRAKPTRRPTDTPTAPPVSRWRLTIRRVPDRTRRTRRTSRRSSPSLSLPIFCACSESARSACPGARGGVRGQRSRLHLCVESDSLGGILCQWQCHCCEAAAGCWWTRAPRVVCPSSGNVSITAPTIGVVGGYSAGGSSTLTPTPKTGVIAASESTGLRGCAVGRFMRSYQFFS